MKKLKVMSIFGTRPEAIKMAPVVLEMKKYPEFIESIVTVTAQHREMLDQVLNLFKIEPDYDLNLMAKNQTLFDITSRVLLGLNTVLTETKPDVILVHGDTTTTFASALAAFYQQIKVGHVEAGLRTGDKFSPFPEEINRKLTGSLADFHFAPTKSSKENLLKENTPVGNIFMTGNTVVDAFKATVKADYIFTDPSLENCHLNSNSRFLLVTTHRRENLGEPLRNIYRALRSVIHEYPDVEIIFPMHKNPKVRSIVAEELGNEPRIHLIEPLDYEPFANLIAKSYIILTDSGGIQEEAPAMGVPVLVLRDTTERPEAVDAGTVKLVGTSYEKIYAELKSLLDSETEYQKMAESCNPYGDGLAARRIISWLLEHYKYPVSREEEFN